MNHLLPREDSDTSYMRRALELAERGWGQVAPNPLVGCVLVRDGVVVGEGFHARWSGAHAEVEALRAAGERARGATAYVTLEPCAHHGKTPPCVEALIAAGVARVVAAQSDPNRLAGGGAERLRSAGIPVTIGVLQSEARELNAAFFHAFHSGRPWITLKLAVSIDGGIAAGDRRRRQLTGGPAQIEVHRARAASDAVAVGIGTALADDPELTVRLVPPPREAPLRIVFDRRGRLPEGARLVRTAREVPTLVVTAPGRQSAHLARAGVRVVEAASLEEGLHALRGIGVRSVLVEGGAALGSALVAEGCVDRLIIFQAPLVLGAGLLPAFGDLPAPVAAALGRLSIVRRAELGDDLVTTYALSDP